ncbi:MAG: PQQ-like beta-propeller repeat protein [Myxococcales bacterium]|nr:MAG: PQQ-like beta-propeller repeat protein [Myxococcales bacterium]
MLSSRFCFCWRPISLAKAVAWLWFCASLVACGSDSIERELIVELRTDLVPGIEFVGVRTTLQTDAGILGAETEALKTDDYIAAARIAEFRQLQTGDMTITVELLDFDGNTIVSRPTKVILLGRLGLTVVITRSCLNVQCPQTNGDPNATACLAGNCVDTRCHPGNPSYCPDLQCLQNTDCADQNACSEANCLDGACLYTSLAKSCVQDIQWCIPEQGCVDFCADGLHNENESDVDCGGPLCPACGSGLSCFRSSDCLSQICSSETCVEASCSDNLRNAQELGIDCGGSGCPDCWQTEWAVQHTERDRLPATIFALTKGIAVDSSGNVYSVGTQGEFESLPASSSTRLFIEKSSSSGSQAWKKHTPFTGGNDFHTMQVSGANVSTNNNLYIAGHFPINLDFDGTVLQSVNTNTYDIFLASFLSNGTLRWAKRFGGTGNDQANGMVTDINGNTYLAGSFEGSFTFSGNPVVAKGVIDGLILKIDPNGAETSAMSIGVASSATQVTAIDIDSNNNFYITGWFSSDAFDLGNGVLANEGSSDVFVASYTSSGTLRWAKNWGSTAGDSPLSIRVADPYRVCFYATFGDEVTIGQTSFDTTSLGSGIVSCLSSTSGSPVWVYHLKSTGNTDILAQLHTDLSRYLYALVSYSGDLTFSGKTFQAGTDTDIVLLRFDIIDGTIGWAENLGSSQDDIGATLFVSDSGKAYLGGSSASSIDFGSGTIGSTGTDPFAWTTVLDIVDHP